MKTRTSKGILRARDPESRACGIRSCWQVVRRHLRRIEEIPSDNDLLVVRWRTDLGEDWWPAKVIKTVEDNVEVVYTGYEGDDGSETIELGGDLWTADVRCLGDDREPVFDSRDAALLDGGDFGDMAVEAEDDDEE